MNTSNMLASTVNHGGTSVTGQQHNGSNLGMYSGANNLDQDQDQKKNASPDFDNIGEDLIMMNIPREGNAD